jgi:primosomal protein N' (replication factor Y)
MADDLDDSWREQGSPNTHVRELALMRAGDKVSLLFAAPYRSLELQRLVDIGYLAEHPKDSAPPRISFTEPGLRLDSASFEIAKESIKKGPLLVVMPRKGSSAAAYCQSCGERQRCDCGGYIWEPTSGRYECRVCSKLHTACQACGSANLRRGRTGSQRTVAEIGKAFPNSTIYEATAEKVPAVSDKPNTIVVATPGSAPRLASGYAGLLVLDCDIWLAAQHLTAEQLAMRDWTESLELLSPNARAVFEGLGSHLGQPLALWQHVELAKSALAETSALKLPPSMRIASLEATPKVLEEALLVATKSGAEVIKNSGAKALIRFKYSQGVDVAQGLRAVAIKASARTTASGNRRGLKIVMDDMKALNS